MATGTHGDESANRTSNKLNKTNPLPNCNAGLSSPCPCAAVHRCGWKRTSCIAGSCGGFPCKTRSTSLPPSLPLSPSLLPRALFPLSPRLPHHAVALRVPPAHWPLRQCGRPSQKDECDVESVGRGGGKCLPKAGATMERREQCAALTLASFVATPAAPAPLARARISIQAPREHAPEARAGMAPQAVRENSCSQCELPRPLAFLVTGHA